ncbi:helix-turn-helix domain-containing protein [Tsukamurella paurometabola]|uniref:Helix-turn-helix domain-containing protein n=1 Tax=Tsukamurella paurometabola TaxID=2061 RepID=A0ABS5NJ90_TSUPA|nr:helix-turn-helix domain-containing protein [Tsukamurella paurometabola]MBS4104376.1 helix-turn-helix domain-containing protein [Tsukamurella paurometabola]
MQNTTASSSTPERASSTSRTLLTFEDLQERLRISRSRVFELTTETNPDPIPTFRIGRRRYVREQDLDAWLDRRAEAA